MMKILLARQKLLFRTIVSVMVFLFGTNMVLVPVSFAQVAFLPAAGAMVSMTPKFDPMVVKGIKLYPDNPFKFDFIVDTGDMALSRDEIKTQGQKLASYFLASLTTPEKEMWVNLSPYEKSRIIPSAFGDTEMGKELLSEDYMLKQIMATALYPERQLGKEFWQRVYNQASQEFGTTNVPVSTFNKVWIVPDEALVYENAQLNSVFVVQSRLKVMLEQDYLAFKNNQRQPGDMFKSELQRTCPQAGCQANERLNVKAPQGNPGSTSEDVNALGSQIIREIVIPALTKEVNEGKNFAGLRQVYQSLILAAWYKKNLKDNVLAKGYVDRNKTLGVDTQDKQITEKIYQQYLRAYRKGVYNYIKEEIDPATQQMIPRKYFSGGANFAMIIHNLREANAAQIAQLDSAMAGEAKLRKLVSISVVALALGLAALLPNGAEARGISHYNQNQDNIAGQLNRQELARITQPSAPQSVLPVVAPTPTPAPAAFTTRAYQYTTAPPVTFKAPTSVRKTVNPQGHHYSTAELNKLSATGALTGANAAGPTTSTVVPGPTVTTSATPAAPVAHQPVQTLPSPVVTPESQVKFTPMPAAPAYQSSAPPPVNQIAPAPEIERFNQLSVQGQVVLSGYNNPSDFGTLLSSAFPNLKQGIDYNIGVPTEGWFGKKSVSVAFAPGLLPNMQRNYNPEALKILLSIAKSSQDTSGSPLGGAPPPPDQLVTSNQPLQHNIKLASLTTGPSTDASNPLFRSLIPPSSVTSGAIPEPPIDPKYSPNLDISDQLKIWFKEVNDDVKVKFPGQNLELRVTGGFALTGHVSGSDHKTHRAIDFHLYQGEEDVTRVRPDVRAFVEADFATKPGAWVEQEERRVSKSSGEAYGTGGKSFHVSDRNVGVQYPSLRQQYRFANNPKQIASLRDNAMLVKQAVPTGGIDLEKLILNTKGGGVRTAFSDPRILQMLLEAKGLFPQIQSIELMTVPMVEMLLGFNTQANNAS